MSRPDQQAEATPWLTLGPWRLGHRRLAVEDVEDPLDPLPDVPAQIAGARRERDGPVDLETGALVRHGSARHPDGTEVDPALWLKLDSFSLIQALVFLAGRVVAVLEELGVKTVSS